MVIAKQATATVNKTEEHAPYTSLLNANANSLADVVRSTYGNTAANQFEQVWGIQNGFLVDYTIGLVSHNDAKSNGAKSGLANGFVPQFVQFITDVTQVAVNQRTKMEFTHITQILAVIDDAAAQSYPKMYTDLRTAYGGSAAIGDLLAIRAARLFPDKFPGDPSIKVVDVRVSMNLLLQEHSYLATMTTDAAAAKRTAEQPGATASLSANTDAIGKLFTEMSGAEAGTQIAQIWGARNFDLIVYATNGDDTARQNLTEKFVARFYALSPGASGIARDQVVATIKVIDDQRSKSFKVIADDDRAAAAAMRPIADRIK